MFEQQKEQLWSGYLTWSVWKLVSLCRIRAWRRFMHESVQKEWFKSHLINVICFSCYTNHLPALESDIWGLVALFGIWKNGQFGSVIKSTILIAPKIQQKGFLDASYRKWIYWMITLGGDRSRVTGCFFDELKFSEFFTWPISWISLFLVILN